MRIEVNYGCEKLALDVAQQNLIPAWRQCEPAPLGDPAAAVRQALEVPFHFPPLRRALTPDDHVAIVVDESLPHLPKLLTAVLEHLKTAAIHADSVTLVCPSSGSNQPWLDHIPDEFDDVHVEIHDPADRKKLSYLATTKHGRRVYVNRTVVDADQTVVLTRRGYDTNMKYSGAETDLYPALSDEKTLKEFCGKPVPAPAGNAHTNWRQEASEVAWLLGAPFFVQIVEGIDQSITSVVAGVQESSAEGERQLNSGWRVEVNQTADVVVACLSGNPENQGFLDFARASANAAKVVKRDGRIILLTDSEPDVADIVADLRQTADPKEALQLLRKKHKQDGGYHWAMAAKRAGVYLLSRLPMDIVEDMLATPLIRAGEAQRLLTDDRTVAVLPDAHKIKAVLRRGD